MPADALEIIDGEAVIVDGEAVVSDSDEACCGCGNLCFWKYTTVFNCGTEGYGEITKAKVCLAEAPATVDEWTFSGCIATKYVRATGGEEIHDLSCEECNELTTEDIPDETAPGTAPPGCCPMPCLECWGECYSPEISGTWEWTFTPPSGPTPPAAMFSGTITGPKFTFVSGCNIGNLFSSGCGTGGVEYEYVQFMRAEIVDDVQLCRWHIVKLQEQLIDGVCYAWDFSIYLWVNPVTGEITVDYAASSFHMFGGWTVFGDDPGVDLDASVSTVEIDCPEGT